MSISRSSSNTLLLLLSISPYKLLVHFFLRSYSSSRSTQNNWLKCASTNTHRQSIVARMHALHICSGSSSTTITNRGRARLLNVTNAIRKTTKKTDEKSDFHVKRNRKTKYPPQTKGFFRVLGRRWSGRKKWENRAKAEFDTKNVDEEEGEREKSKKINVLNAYLESA